MHTQLFELNIPAELTRSKSNGRSVYVAAHRFDDGKLWNIDFLAVSTTLMIEVTNWLAVWNIAQDRAETLWNEKTDVINISTATEELKVIV